MLRCPPPLARGAHVLYLASRLCQPTRGVLAGPRRQEGWMRHDRQPGARGPHSDPLLPLSPLSPARHSPGSLRLTVPVLGCPVHASSGSRRRLGGRWARSRALPPLRLPPPPDGRSGVAGARLGGIGGGALPAWRRRRRRLPFRPLATPAAKPAEVPAGRGGGRPERSRRAELVGGEGWRFLGGVLSTKKAPPFLSLASGLSREGASGHVQSAAASAPPILPQGDCFLEIGQGIV